MEGSYKRGLEMKTMVVMPTYNEADNLPKIVAELLSLDVDGLEILIVDDNSPDGTGQVAEELKRCYPDCIHVIHRPEKMGLGKAYITGFRYALEHRADYIVEMDADFSHSPNYIPQFLENIANYDVVVGSRYVSGGKLDEKWGLWRYFLSWWANSVYTRLILGLRVKDATSGFKCFRRRVLEEIGLENIKSSGYVFQVEIAYLCEKKGFRVLEIPIYFEDRRIGQSKMTMPVKLEAAWRVWDIKWRYRGL
ncbi:MAG: polyprenol monophosphomannose synthase [Anaerolineae bacterium]